MSVAHQNFKDCISGLDVTMPATCGLAYRTTFLQIRIILDVDLTSNHLILPNALFAEVAVPRLALVRVVLAVVALLALVAPIVAVHVAVADLLLVDVVRARAHVLVRVVLAVGRLPVAPLRLRDALSGRGALELVVLALLVRVDLGAVKAREQWI